MKQIFTRTAVTLILSVAVALIMFLLSVRFDGLTVFVGFVAIMVVAMHGIHTSQIENLSMDLDMMEQRLGEIDPEYQSTRLRFRYMNIGKGPWSPYGIVVVFAGIIGYSLSQQ